MTDTTSDILAARAKQHGNYTTQSNLSQSIKDLMRNAPGWVRLTAYQKESLEMNAVKVSRILEGNPMIEDHWADIAGYARLAGDRVADENQIELFTSEPPATLKENING